MGSTHPCGSDRRELRRERDFCSPSEAGCEFPFESSLFLSFDRAPLVRPFDAPDLPFERLGVDDDAGPGDSVAAVVVGVVAEETGREVAGTRRVGLGSGDGAGRRLSAGSSSMRSFALTARCSKAAESGIGRGTTSVQCVSGIGCLKRTRSTFEKPQRRTLSCDCCWTLRLSEETGLKTR
jgi:hypothetical protein